MREQLEARLQALTEEFEKGQSMLRDVELERARLEQTLARIDGAMTVLRELLEAEDAPAAGEGDARVASVA